MRPIDLIASTVNAAPGLQFVIYIYIKKKNSCQVADCLLVKLIMASELFQLHFHQCSASFIFPDIV